MMIPVDGAAEDSPEVTTYNEVQKRARSSIDQTFGILKARRAKTTQKLLSSVDTVTVSIKIRKKMAAARPRGSRRAALPAAGRPPGGRLPTRCTAGYHRHVE
ncbi:hypothetical protein MSG28_010478 [Choristoneura fumiferana]|uniref:Uncharacterized protein n=1 Tax=Choristoneura fumiferana TaxID=7141 RepID=A0ACC0KL15_CHOFU|nr:hypothetical protein MSG28_010478 [Choristoneura fumiferana]